MKFVTTKNADQLDLQALHRVRGRLVSQTALARTLSTGGSDGSFHPSPRPDFDDERAEALRQLGAEVMQSDLTDLTARHRAIEGCARVYFGMSVSADYLTATVITAAVARHHGVEAFVNMSRAGASMICHGPELNGVGPIPGLAAKPRGPKFSTACI